MNVLITGTSRGIGLKLTELTLQRGHSVIALARNAEKSKPLQSLQADYREKIRLISADLTAPDVTEKISSAAQSFGNIDILINNAGILLQGDSTEDFLQSFHVNSVVPYQLTKSLLPYLKKSENPRVIHITSLMGSIRDNASGGYYAYRSSKAALNMINKSLTVDNPWLMTLLLHPGWVQTDMGGKNATTTVEESANGIWQQIEELDMRNSGQFFDFRGKSLDW